MSSKGPLLIFVAICLVPLGVFVGLVANYFFNVWWGGVSILAVSVSCLLFGAYYELCEVLS